MSFVSAEFPIFMAVVFMLYYLSTSIRIQNLVILISSYVFYGFWDWRFIPLLFGISIANYVAAILIAQTSDPVRKRVYLWVAVAISLAALAFFKYFNFFVASAVSGAALFGVKMQLPVAQILLPLGISFMTFQGMAYVVDVWRGEHAAERDLVRFLAFKAFFPQLVAGPIERAEHLLDQSPVPDFSFRAGTDEARTERSKAIAATLGIDPDHILKTPATMFAAYFSGYTHLNRWGKTAFTATLTRELAAKR